MAKHESNGNCLKCQEIMYNTIMDSTLREWFESLQKDMPFVHVAHAFRGKKEQDQYFREGKSKAKFGQSPHNYIPTMAIDIFFLKNGKYNLDLNILETIFNNLPNGIEWGGKFKFFDGPHFQVKDWKLKVVNYPLGNKKD